MGLRTYRTRFNVEMIALVISGLWLAPTEFRLSAKSGRIFLLMQFGIFYLSNKKRY